MELPVYSYPEYSLEVPQGRSETLPNRALSIRDIMERSLRGQMIPNPYPEDPEDIDLDKEYYEDKFDMMDKLSYLEERYEAMKIAQDRKKAEEEVSKRSEVNDESKLSPKDE